MQSFSDWELIIVASDLTPNAALLADELCKDRRVRLEKVPAEGIYSAFNWGILKARGRYITWLHAGDEWVGADYLESAFSLLQDDDNAVFGAVEFVDKCGRIRRSWRDSAESPFGWGWMPPHPTVITSRQNYIKVGLFDLRFNISADYHWLIRLSKIVRWIHCENLVYRLVIGGASTSGWESQCYKFFEDYKICRETGFRMPLVAVVLKRVRKFGQWW